MGLGVIIGVGVAGGIGALTRFAMDASVSRRAIGRFPFGTLAVNLWGAFVLGVVAGASLAGNAKTLIETGLLGAFTTFSTWMLESQRAAEDGEGRVGVANIVISLVAGFALVWAGRKLGSAF